MPKKSDKLQNSKNPKGKNIAKLLKKELVMLKMEIFCIGWIIIMNECREFFYVLAFVALYLAGHFYVGI